MTWNYLDWSDRSAVLLGQRSHDPVPVDLGITTLASATAPTGSGSGEPSDGSVVSEASPTGAVSSVATSGVASGVSVSASAATESDPESQSVPGAAEAVSWSITPTNGLSGTGSSAESVGGWSS